MNKITEETLQERMCQLRKSFNEAIARPIGTETRVYTKYIAFNLDREYFALPVASIKEVLVNQRIIPLPVKHKIIYGVMNYKNEVLPVTNLHHLLGLSSVEVGQTDTLLLTRGLAVETALLVDKILAVLDIADADIRPKPISLDHNAGEMIIGEFYHQGQLVTILNPVFLGNPEEDGGAIK